VLCRDAGGDVFVDVVGDVMKAQEKTREELVNKANASRKARAVKMNNDMLADALRIHAQLLDSGNEYAQYVLKMASAMFYPEYHSSEQTGLELRIVNDGQLNPTVRSKQAQV
jgi:hypothetical protein